MPGKKEDCVVSLAAATTPDTTRAEAHCSEVTEGFAPMLTTWPLPAHTITLYATDPRPVGMPTKGTVTEGKMQAGEVEASVELQPRARETILKKINCVLPR
ncbi:hypothetical protein SUGI_0464510 [Cryptomeria japonica]|nr:hypothetical protein SUGI_0464510 [Cryptomeria japonica]